MQALVRTNDAMIDELEAMMFEAAMNDESDVYLYEPKYNHYFYKGFYVREMLVEAHKLISSEVHKTCHLFEIVQGTISINIDNKGWQTFSAFHEGTTAANTRRIGFTWENTVWRTYHPLEWITGNENDLPQEEKLAVLEKVRDEIIEPYVNELLGGEVFMNKITNRKKELV